MAEEARAGDKGRSPLKKVLPGPGLSGTLLPDPMAACKAKRAARLACLRAPLPAPCLQMDRGHGLTGTSRQATHPWTPAPHGAATAQLPRPGWEETGRDKFISSSVSFFRSHFWDTFFSPPKNPTQNLTWTKTRADCISSQFHSQPVCLSPLPRRGQGTSTPGSSRQPRLPSQDPAQQGLGTSSIRKEQVCPSISLFQL